MLFSENDPHSNDSFVMRLNISTKGIRRLIELFSETVEPLPLPAMQQSSLQQSPTSKDISLVETRVEDGKLLYERRWFHRGQSVYVEGRDMVKFPASISAIGTEAVSIYNV